MAAGINDTFRQVGVPVGIAALGAIFIGTGSDRVAELTAGSPAADGDRQRLLIEAASSGNLDQALTAAPPDGREPIAAAVGDGFVTRPERGAGDRRALLAFAGAIVSLWLVREGEIEREPLEAEPEAEAVPPTPLLPDGRCIAAPRQRWGSRRGGAEPAPGRPRSPAGPAPSPAARQGGDRAAASAPAGASC